ARADLLDGIETGWARFGAVGARVDEAVEGARAALHRDRPAAAVDELLAVRRALRALPPCVRRDDALRDVDDLLAAAAGLFVRATAARPDAVPGARIDVEVEILARAAEGVSLQSIAFPDGGRAGGAALPLGEKVVVARDVAISADAPITTPH